MCEPRTGVGRGPRAILSAFEAILKRFRSDFDHFGQLSTGKMGVRTAGKVLERRVLTLGQKKVLEKSNTWQRVVLEQLF